MPPLTLNFLHSVFCRIALLAYVWLDGESESCVARSQGTVQKVSHPPSSPHSPRYSVLPNIRVCVRHGESYFYSLRFWILRFTVSVPDSCSLLALAVTLPLLPFVCRKVQVSSREIQGAERQAAETQSEPGTGKPPS
jgi:hypothetical protein